MHKRKAVGGDEEDAFFARQFYHWKAGRLRAIKKKANKRERKQWKKDIE